MKIQVFGPGCPSCHKLYELTKQALQELNMKDEVEYIKDVTKLIEMRIMQAPVLAINNKPVMIGFVPNIEKIKELIKQGGNNNPSKTPKCSCRSGCC